MDLVEEEFVTSRFLFRVLFGLFCLVKMSDVGIYRGFIELIGFFIFVIFVDFGFIEIVDV